MSDATNNETLKIEITQAKILDCLMHGATREDIAELRREMKADIARLDDKIDSKASKNDISELRTSFNWLIGLMFGGFTLMLGGLTTIGIMVFNVMK